ncbi:glycosyltransferase [Poriferisphaera sp. WC338]|uniref:glycosyltransferase n=1 Tax=Poriferisphaera sp. WC338 TaxID=3425129 RepID=UPI003D817296
MNDQRFPITAIIIYRNEAQLLEESLSALSWCDEIITIDMQSEDDSANIAADYSDRMLEVDPYPIAEPTRVAAAKLAKHDWVFFVDPDEVIPPKLATDIQDAITNNSDAATINLPIRFYFRRRLLTGTVWGTATHVQKIAHRKRATILPLCNRLMEPNEGYRKIDIPHRIGNHLIHLWSFSYRDLMRKHFLRYPHLEAKARVARGESISLSRLLISPFKELKVCLKDFDGWRMGTTGFALSFIYFIYSALSVWFMPYYKLKVKQDDTTTHAELPELREAFPQQPFAHELKLTEGAAA